MRAVVLSFFFLSGACGLLYEVAWVRAAGTVIGNTTAAVGTVVAVYMGGLGLGAWLGGRVADRRTGARLLALYAVLEAGVAVTALAVLPLLGAAEPVFRVAWSLAGDLPPLHGALRALLVALVLLPPTTLMGATLPVLSRFLSSSVEAAPREAGRAYAVNALGGVAGTLAAGFWLVPGVGLRATVLLAAALNLAVAAASGLLARGRGGETLPQAEPGPAARRPALAVAALSGFCSLVYEVAWTRSLVLSLGSTVYAFTLILAAFILGLALGSAAAAFFVPRLRRPERSLGGVQAAIGALAVALLPFLGDLPVRIAPLMESLRGRHGALLAAEFGLAGLFVLLPAVFMGAVFPLTCRLAGGSGAGRAVGAVYAWNTLGCIVGSLAASFALVPTVGLSAAIRGAATVNFGLAACLLGKRAAALPLALAAAAWLLPAWNPKVLASGSFLYASIEGRSARAGNVDLRTHLEQESDLLAQYWDSYGLVTVHRRRSDGTLSMRVNGKTDASTGPLDRANMLYVGHLPLLCHPEPKRALLVGLGAGLSLAAMERHPLERIDCVEISRAVVRGAAHFREPVGDVLGDPRARLIVGDGRNVLSFGRESYDVIISQPSNLWISGMANLFTREFFERASERLAPGGLFAQWLHAYRLSAEDFRLVVRTFYSVFPHGGLWEVFPGSDYLMVGARQPVRPAPDVLASRLAATRALEEYLGPEPASGLLGHFIADAADAAAAAGRGPLLTDDHCRIEYTAPRSLGRETSGEVLEWIDGLRRRPAEGESQAVARRRAARGALSRAVALRSEGYHARALRTIAEARSELFLDPRTRAFIDLTSREIVESAARRRAEGRLQGVAATLKAVPPEAASYVEAQLELGDLYLVAGALAEAGGHFREAQRSDPSSFGAAVGLAQIHQAEGRLEEAVVAWKEALAKREDSAPAHYELAVCLRRLGRLEEARRSAARAAALEPENPRIRRLAADLAP
jgi:spermidine synthase